MQRLYRVIQNVALKLKERIRGMKYNNFTIGTHDVRYNPKPVHGCKCIHPSAMYINFGKVVILINW